jgi:hypothetical protein
MNNAIIDHARTLDPILRALGLQAASIDPPLRHPPGRRSHDMRRCFWRASDCAPAPVASHRIVHD